MDFLGFLIAPSKDRCFREHLHSELALRLELLALGLSKIAQIGMPGL